MTSMDKVLCDYDWESKKLDDGLQITRMPKLKSRSNADLRMQYKTKYLNKKYSALSISTAFPKQLEMKI